MIYEGDRDLDSYIEDLQPVEDRDEDFDPIISNRRRIVIRYLSMCEPEAVIPINELASVCAAVERNMPVSDVTNSDYTHIRQGLKDRDWPLLEDHGIVETIDEIRVRRGERFEYYNSMLDTLYRSMQ